MRTGLNSFCIVIIKLMNTQLSTIGVDKSSNERTLVLINEILF